MSREAGCWTEDDGRGAQDYTAMIATIPERTRTTPAAATEDGGVLIGRTPGAVRLQRHHGAP
jgi:hypothetical protein